MCTCRCRRQSGTTLSVPGRPPPHPPPAVTQFLSSLPYSPASRAAEIPSSRPSCLVLRSWIHPPQSHSPGVVRPRWQPVRPRGSARAAAADDSIFPRRLAFRESTARFREPPARPHSLLPLLPIFGSHILVKSSRCSCRDKQNTPPEAAPQPG